MNTHRPNVVLVVTDQQRFDTIRAAGRKTVQTPNLDRLAAEGTLFTHAYCTSPMCSPSRASILSGRMPSSHGMVANHQACPGDNLIHLSEDVKVLADYLGPAGYHTAYIGKWHLGTVSYIDHLMGRMLDALSDTGQLDNTLFIFTSDHGDLMGSHSLILKGASLYEELIRVPFIVRLPAEMRENGIAPHCDGLVSQIDIVPTILSLCGLPPEPEVEGVDLSPLLTGAADSVRDAVQAEFHSTSWTDPMSPLRMWRTEDWKYVESRAGDNELYHLAEDPLETRNLAEDPRYTEQRTRMAEALHDWCRRSGDPWPEVPAPAAHEMKPVGPRHHYCWFHRKSEPDKEHKGDLAPPPGLL